MMGSTLIEEALSDMVQESCFATFGGLGRRVYFWKFFGRGPEPENKDEVLAEVRADVIKAVNHIQSVAEKRGKKYIISDTVSCLFILGRCI